METSHRKILKLWKWQIISQPQLIQPTAISVFPFEATDTMDLRMSSLRHVLAKYLSNRTVRDNHDMVLVLSHSFGVVCETAIFRTEFGSMSRALL